MTDAPGLDRLGNGGWSLLAAGTFGVGAMLTAWSVGSLLDPDLGLLLAPVATVCGGLVGGPAWWLLVERPAGAGWLHARGAVAGLVTGVLANVTTWVLTTVLLLLAALAPSGTPAPGIGYGIALLLLFGAAAAVLGCVVTGPVGTVLGLGLAVLRGRVVDDAPADGRVARTAGTGHAVEEAAGTDHEGGREGDRETGAAALEDL